MSGLSMTMPNRGMARLIQITEVGNVSNSAKVAVTAIFAIVGILALVVAVIYVAVPIHSLPSFIPGKHPVNGHYHKRALVAAVTEVWSPLKVPPAPAFVSTVNVTVTPLTALP